MSEQRPDAQNTNEQYTPEQCAQEQDAAQQPPQQRRRESHFKLSHLNLNRVDRTVLIIFIFAVLMAFSFFLPAQLAGFSDSNLFLQVHHVEAEESQVLATGSLLLVDKLALLGEGEVLPVERGLQLDQEQALTVVQEELKTLGDLGLIPVFDDGSLGGTLEVAAYPLFYLRVQQPDQNMVVWNCWFTYENNATVYACLDDETGLILGYVVYRYNTNFVTSRTINDLAQGWADYWGVEILSFASVSEEQFSGEELVYNWRDRIALISGAYMRQDGRNTFVEISFSDSMMRVGSVY